MDASIKKRIEDEAQHLGHVFRDPDLITFDPVSRGWQFVEIKRIDTNDKLTTEQRSLELLERVVPILLPS